MNNHIRAIAFYLPQFHPVPENDEWWGKGFTEWTNVTKAKPAFRNHYQPHLPSDLGFYDLRLPEIREQQAELARQYGIHGFCYYHYWFNGRRILERPLNEVLSSGNPDFPFCVCWANENWTRVWDGGEKELLLKQEYSLEDDRAHIRSLIDTLSDERYIRIDNKPLFLVYRTGLLPNPKMTSDVWREEAQKAGLADLYLVRVESHGDYTDPADIGFDASVQFSPFSGLRFPLVPRNPIAKLLANIFMGKAFAQNNIFDYQEVVNSMLNLKPASYERYYCATPSWDNSARRKTGASILLNSSPSLYQDWLEAILSRTNEKFPPEKRLVFINAWNEWAEGNHLEPDQKWGLDYLHATKKALMSEQILKSDSEVKPLNEHGFNKEPEKQFAGLRSAYWRLGKLFDRVSKLLKYTRFEI